MIPYNPSSFNSNKTILEQILELKKWLKEHPSYAVYTTYIHYKPAENVDYFFTEINGDPDFVDNIAVGDLLWFGDGYISPIASITIDPNDRENSYVTISQPVTSLIGPTGPQGPRGYDGVSVTNASVNASGYLIITLSNGLTVNTGYVVGPQGPQGPQGPTGATGPQGPTGPSGVSITNVAIDGNSHLIVTLSDGSSIDAGSVSSGGTFDNYITVATPTGTLTDAQYNKLLQEDSVIIVDNGTEKQYYKKWRENSSYIYFERIYRDTSVDKLVIISVNKSTKVTTQSLYQIRISSDWSVDTTESTDGQVLTSKGAGMGTEWRNVGGTTLNHYTTEITANSVTNRKQIYDILKDAKIARIGVRESADDYAMIAGNYVVKGNYINMAFYGVNFATTTIFNYIFSWNNDGTSMESDKYTNAVTTPTTITATRYTASTLNASSIKIYIDYYNETQLHT